MTEQNPDKESLVSPASTESDSSVDGSANTSNHGATDDARKLSKKARRKRAQRQQLITFGAIVAVVLIVVGGVLWFVRWQGEQIETLPADQRITAVVGDKEVEIPPYSVCELDDRECAPGQPFSLDLAGAKEFTVKVPRDISDHDWAVLEIFDDPGANEQTLHRGNEATEITIPVESPRLSADGTHPALAVVEVHSMLVGLDAQGENTPMNVVWSISPRTR